MKAIMESQRSYLDLLTSYVPLLEKEHFNVADFRSLSDDIRFFWAARIDAVEADLVRSVGERECFMLAGGSCLDFSGLEHFAFKAVGGLQFLADPFLALEDYCGHRVMYERLNLDSRLREVHIDIRKMLAEYGTHFYMLPLFDLAVPDKAKHYEHLNEVFEGLFQDLFVLDEDQYRSLRESSATYEEIEELLRPGILQRLLLVGSEEELDSLRARVENYLGKGLSGGAHNLSDCQRFYVALHGRILQLLDSVSVCAALGMIPFVRSKVMLNFLFLLRGCFSDEPTVGGMLESAAWTFLCASYVRACENTDLNFEEFAGEVQQAGVMINLRELLRAQRLDIFSAEGLRVARILAEQELRKIVM